MRIALFSDIHGNIVGLHAVLARLDQLGGADVLFALGDFLAIGPGADDLLDLLMTRHVRMVRGNWDEIFMDPARYLARTPAHRRPVVERHFAWLQRHLSTDAQQLLATLPIQDELVFALGRKLFVCHAAPADPWSATCTPSIPIPTLRHVYGGLDAEVVAFGHYHAHHIMRLDNKILVNVASVGMHPQGDALSAITIIDATEERVVIQQYQVPYDGAAYERLCRERAVPLST